MKIQHCYITKHKLKDFGEFPIAPEWVTVVMQ